MKIFGDHRIIARFRAGDEDGAFNEILDRYAGWLYTKLSRRLRRRGEAADLTQQAFFLLFGYLRSPKCDESDSIEVLLTGYAQRLATDQNRHETTVEARLAEYAAEAEKYAVPADAELDAKVLGTRLKRAIEALPWGLRKVAKPYFLCHFKPQEIAEMLQIDVRVVWDRIGRVRRILRVELAPFLTKGSNHGRMGQAVYGTGRSTAGVAARLPGEAVGPHPRGVPPTAEEAESLAVRGGGSGGGGDRRLRDGVEALGRDGAAGDADDGEPTDVC